jgi:hypothetical protein
MDPLGLSLTGLESIAAPLPGHASIITRSSPSASLGPAESCADAATGEAHLSTRSVRYEGGVVRGVREGEGVLMVLADGTRYSGPFVGGEPHGRGAIDWPDGSRYVGSVVRGVRHGKGAMRHAASGTEYEGDWVGGQREGWGEARYADGSFYRGGWACDARHGRGALVHASGNVYVGEWAADEKTGLGRFTWVEGASAGQEYVGAWAGGAPHGWGVHTWYAPPPAGAGGALHAAPPPGDPAAPPGAFAGWPVVCRYKGEFVRGAREGAGTMAYATGGAYHGCWAANEKAGAGVWAAADGTVFDAVFEGDTPVDSLAGALAAAGGGGGATPPPPGAAPSPQPFSGEGFGVSGGGGASGLLSPKRDAPPAAPLLPGVTLQPAHAKSVVSSDALYAVAVADAGPTDSAMLAWMEAQCLSSAEAQVSVALPGAARPTRGGAALASRLRRQCTARLAGVLLRWNSRLVGWYGAYARAPLPGESGGAVGETAATPPSDDAALADSGALRAYLAALAASPCIGVAGPAAPPAAAPAPASAADVMEAAGGAKQRGGAPLVLRLGQLWAFARDSGLLVPPAVSCATVGHLLAAARARHSRRVAEAAGRLLALARLRGGGAPPPRALVAALAAVVRTEVGVLNACAGAGCALPGALRAAGGLPPAAQPPAPLSPLAPVLLRDFVEVVVRLVLARAGGGGPVVAAPPALSPPLPSPPPAGEEKKGEEGDAPSAPPPSKLLLAAAAAAGNSMYAAAARAAAPVALSLLTQKAATAVLAGGMPRAPWGGGGTLTGGVGGSTMASRPVGAGQYTGRFGEPPPCLFTTSSVALLSAPGEARAAAAAAAGDPDGPALLLDAALLHVVSPRARAPPPAAVLSSPPPPPDAPPPPPVTPAMVAAVLAAASKGGSARSVAALEEGIVASGRGAASVATSATRLSLSGQARRLKMDPDAAAAAAAARAPPAPAGARDALRAAADAATYAAPPPPDLTPRALAAACTGGKGPVSITSNGRISAGARAVRWDSDGDAPRSGPRGRGAAKARGGTTTAPAAFVAGLRDAESGLGRALGAVAAAALAHSPLDSAVAAEGGAHGATRAFADVRAALALLALPAGGVEEGGGDDEDGAEEEPAAAEPRPARVPTVGGLLAALEAAGLLETPAEGFSREQVDAALSPPPPPPPPPVSRRGSQSLAPAAAAPPPPAKGGKPPPAAASPAKGAPPPAPVAEAPAAAPPAPPPPPPPPPGAAPAPSPAATALLDASPALAQLAGRLAAVLRAQPVFNAAAVLRLAVSAAAPHPPSPRLCSTGELRIGEGGAGGGGWWFFSEFSGGGEGGGGVRAPGAAAALPAWVAAPELRPPRAGGGGEDALGFPAVGRAGGGDDDSADEDEATRVVERPLPVAAALGMPLLGAELAEAVLRVAAGFAEVSAARGGGLPAALAAVAEAGEEAAAALRSEWEPPHAAAAAPASRRGSTAQAGGGAAAPSPPPTPAKGAPHPLAPPQAPAPQPLEAADADGARAEALHAALHTLLPRAVARAGAALRLAAAQGGAPRGAAEGGEGVPVQELPAGAPGWAYAGPTTAALPGGGGAATATALAAAALPVIAQRLQG